MRWKRKKINVIEVNVNFYDEAMFTEVLKQTIITKEVKYINWWNDVKKLLTCPVSLHP